MPQQNENVDKGAKSSVTPLKDSAEEDAKNQQFLDEKTVDTKKNSLGICKSAEGMPELKNDQGSKAEEQINLDLSENLPPEVAEYARREIGETEEVKCQALQEFRDMIYEKGACLPHRMDDSFLIRFLRARNFNLNSAHKLIVNYYKFKEEHPEIHQQMHPKEMRYIGDDDVMIIPTYRTQCGRRLIIYRMGNWDPSKYSIEDVFKATVLVLELGVLEPRAQIMGGIVIFDLKDITMQHAWSVTPQVASTILSLMVTAFPMKTYAIHILHQSWIFDVIFTVFKPLLDTNMRNRIHFHGNDYGSLHKHISPESLPKKYGGIRDEIPYYKWIESLIKETVIVDQISQLGYIDKEEVLECFNLK